MSEDTVIANFLRKLESKDSTFRYCMRMWRCGQMTYERALELAVTWLAEERNAYRDAELKRLQNMIATIPEASWEEPPAQPDVPLAAFKDMDKLLEDIPVLGSQLDTPIVRSTGEG